MANAGKMHLLLVQALHQIDRKDLADLWSCSLGAVSKKISGASNINIEEIAAALAAANVKLITDPDMRVVHVDEL
jgi:hypothetical protein